MNKSEKRIKNLNTKNRFEKKSYKCLDTTKENSIFEDWLKNHKLAAYILEHGSLLSIIFTIVTVLGTGFYNYMSFSFLKGYSKYLGLNILLEVDQYNKLGVNIVQAIFTSIIFFFIAFIIYLQKDKIHNKVLMILEVFLEINSILLLLFTMQIFFNTKEFELKTIIPCVFYSIIMFILHFLNHEKVSKCGDMLAYIIFLCIGVVIYIINKINIFSYFSTLLSFIVSLLIFIPCFIMGSPNEKIFKHKMGIYKMFINERKELNKIISIVFSMLVISILFFKWFDIFENSIVELGRKQSAEIRFHTFVEFPFEQNEQNNETIKYVVFDTETNDKILMQVEYLKSIDNGENNCPIYTFKEGEFSYLTNYDKLIFKVEKCRLTPKK